MACDLCGKVGCELEAIREFYATEDIQHVCPACTKVLNAQVMKLQSWTARLQQALMRRFMTERKANPDD